jgi:hypothetical protein
MYKKIIKVVKKIILRFFVYFDIKAFILKYLINNNEKLFFRDRK